MGEISCLRTAQDDNRLGRDFFEDMDQLGGLGGVPDIDPDSDDAGGVFEEPFGDALYLLVDREFDDARLLLQLVQVGVEVAQPQGGMGIAGIEGGEENGVHGVSGK